MTDPSLRSPALVFALAAVALGLAAEPVGAAGRHKAVSRTIATKAAQAPSAKPRAAEPPANSAAVSERTEPTAVWTSGEQERACFRGRRKLWQDGEGWVVKRVNVCP